MFYFLEKKIVHIVFKTMNVYNWPKGITTKRSFKTNLDFKSNLFWSENLGTLLKKRFICCDILHRRKQNMPHALHFKNSYVFGFFYQKYVHAGCLIIKITQDCI